VLEPKDANHSDSYTMDGTAVRPEAESEVESGEIVVEWRND